MKTNSTYSFGICTLSIYCQPVSAFQFLLFQLKMQSFNNTYKCHFHFLQLYNKLIQIQRFKTKHIYYLTLFMGQEPRLSLCGPSFRL